ncbi:MAG: nuclear transport factor 2 family protein [Planctomycetes bacterium]|nr:nuclear transport factor 2 family protein [Planctomycetota bacterium]
MDEPKPSLVGEAEAVKEFYAALNRNDVRAAVTILDSQIERIEPPGFPGEGTYHGLAAVTAHFESARACWAEGSCEPREFTVADDKIIALVDVRVKLKHEEDWREGRVADVFTFRNGKAIQFRTFIDEQLAFEWARGTTTDGN